MENKFRYILAQFRNIYTIPNDVEIGYGAESSARVVVKQFDKDFFQKEQIINRKQIKWVKWKAQEIPVLFHSGEIPPKVITVRNNCAIIHYDIIASAFYFLSGWHEYFFGKISHGRFHYKDSIQKSLDIIEKPVVNYYFDMLKSAIEKAYDIKINRRLWPEHTFATFISHDIDKCESAWLEGSKSELKKGRIFSPANLIVKKLFRNGAWFNLEQIMELEMQHDIRSTFFFIAKKDKGLNPQNADYDLTQKKYQKVISKLRKNKFEIGVHGSIGTHLDSERLSGEISKFKPYPAGVRFHFLRFNMKKTPVLLQDLGLKYDTTLYFAEHIGFRNSFCFPFFLYDIKNDKPYNVLEIPLAIMDATLKEKKYMNLGTDLALSKTKTVVNEVAKFGGCLGVLWHNNYFSNYKYKGWGQVFITLVQACKKQESVFFSGKDIHESWITEGIFQKGRF